ncbi:MAG: hypothetical protein RHS_0272 [Robinsoniella sp. RHS]|uniref:AAA family ATPase n=1 Tax=Robinsoniella sp. RHS TaxID=1504536 RepID=UPI00064A1B45|nr:MAG: hypothetical protein RHS_0272 [Robinsoniella sp. RHS]
MIKKLLIQNFKCFSEKTEIELSKLTANVGMNSVGKSSLIQALLIIRQIYDIMERYDGYPINEFYIDLNKEYALQLGDSEQIMSSHDTDIVCIQVDDIKFELKKNKKDNGSLFLQTEYTLDQLMEHDSIFLVQFGYLNAERLGPRNYQKMGNIDGRFCGFHGEYTFDVINKNQMKSISKKRKFGFDEKKQIDRLEKQVEYWLSYIVPGVEVNFSNEQTMRLTQMQVSQPLMDTGFQSPNNFGFGISYVLPIIVMGLLMKEGAMLIVENPEAHLHPSGQSRIGYFLSQIAADNVQVIIETHSEHVINGIRIHSLKNQIKPSDICINYFSFIEQSHTVNRICLNERMDIERWPDGFFDQEEKDLKELRKLRAKCK